MTGLECPGCQDRSDGQCSSAMDVPGPSHRPIRLDEPRPVTTRSENEYVDVTGLASRQERKHQRTKSRNGNAARRNVLVIESRAGNSGQSSRTSASNSGVQKAKLISQFDPHPASSSADRGNIFLPPGRVVRILASDPSQCLVVDKQPRSIGYRLNYASTGNSSKSALSPAFAQSIICKQCGRCRCNACARPKQLPSRWICGDHCFLSAHSIVDNASCVCCVKAFLYHTSGRVYDSPMDDRCDTAAVCDCSTSAFRSAICGTHSLWSCSRRSTDCCFRWTTLLCACAILPCLWLYLPLRLCAAAVEAAYVNYYDNGCRCEMNDSSRRTFQRRHSYRGSLTLPLRLPSELSSKQDASASARCSQFSGDKESRCPLLGDKIR